MLFGIPNRVTEPSIRAAKKTRWRLILRPSFGEKSLQLGLVPGLGNAATVVGLRSTQPVAISGSPSFHFKMKFSDPRIPHPTHAVQSRGSEDAEIG
jgi:hypothetical protein